MKSYELYGFKTVLNIWWVGEPKQQAPSEINCGNMSKKNKQTVNAALSGC